MSELTNKYQHKTEIEAILHNPGMYINSVEAADEDEWVLSNAAIARRPIHYIPALRQLFEEALLNCRDHSVRSAVSFISVSINKQNGKFTFENDGDPIDVAIHPTEQIYIPELIFAHLRTSTNYDKKSSKMLTGGAWGLGIKLVNIWSKWLRIVVQDATRALSYTQIFEANMSVVHPPTIRPLGAAAKSFLQLSFIPDYERFGVAGVDDALLSLFERRVMDLAAITNNVQVKYNGRMLPRKNFEEYVSYFTTAPRAWRAIHLDAHWKIAVFRAAEFTQLSFVNGICTKEGGTHVDCVVARLVDAVRERFATKPRPQYIRDQLFVLLSCDIVDPKFNSQIKNKLTSPPASFFPLSLSSDFIARVVRLVRDRVLSLMSLKLEQKEEKETEKLKRETDGSKRTTVRGIPTLVDANFAGGARSNQCILIICEGQSACSGVRSGLSSSDRNTIGIYPTRGKLPNLCNVSEKTILENKVVADLKKILGLKSGVAYETTKSLRYGKVVFMTDQDLDGQHIKALGLNMFHVLWPSLLKLYHFMGFIQTPIVKAFRGKEVVSFYRQSEYEAWAATHPSGWRAKYYKGLGTSVAAEFREYMAALKIVYFEHRGADCDICFQKVFERTNANLRKLWLYDYDEKAKMPETPEVSYADFIDRELIHFSKYDCDRSIPGFDGLKISQRKILHAAFAKCATHEIKVAQFAGFVAEHTHYHHGEESLCKAIIGMAQDFVGSNNLNLLQPIGQFGTRLQGGDDAAKPRYPCVQLMKIAKYIFREEDQPVLSFHTEDGDQIEPKHYVPVIPMVLVNGALGIGTGFSAEFLPHNPLDVIDYLLALLSDAAAAPDLLPWVRGFQGTIRSVPDARGKYVVSGVFSLQENTLTITELPVGVWTQPYKEHLDKLLDAGAILDYKDLSTEQRVHFVVGGVRARGADLIKTFKLAAPLSETNMHIFTAENKLVKYATCAELARDFCAVRLATYERRRIYQLEQLERERLLLDNKIRYLRGFIEGTICIRGTAAETIEMLEALAFARVGDSYNYLLHMKFSALQAEEIGVLEGKRKRVLHRWKELTETTAEKMWRAELLELKEQL